MEHGRVEVTPQAHAQGGLSRLKIPSNAPPKDGLWSASASLLFAPTLLTDLWLPPTDVDVVYVF
jgi:hypothetical protein